MQDIATFADLVRQRCIDAALQAYEDAGISGLCAEGRWELAVQAMRCLDLTALVEAVKQQQID